MYGKGDAECDTFDWGKWSPCSMRCGMGKRMRTRVYKIPFVDNRSCNNVNLIERTFCEGVDCDGQVKLTRRKQNVGTEMGREKQTVSFSQDQQTASYAYNDIGSDYGTDGGSDVPTSYDFADESAYPTEDAVGEAAGEGLVALNHQQDDGPYGVVKKYQDDHVCNIQYDVRQADRFSCCTAV